MKFKWHEGALIPEKIVAPFSQLTGKAEDDTTFYEFARTDLVNFVDEALKLSVYVEGKDEKGDPIFEEDGVTPKMVKSPFIDIEEAHRVYLFKYLALATVTARATETPTRSPEWFADLPLTGRMIGDLADMLMELNHVDEVLATQGNWLMLPTIRDAFSEANILDQPTKLEATLVR